QEPAPGNIEQLRLGCLRGRGRRGNIGPRLRRRRRARGPLATLAAPPAPIVTMTLGLRVALALLAGLTHLAAPLATTLPAAAASPATATPSPAPAPVARGILALAHFARPALRGISTRAVHWRAPFCWT